MRDNYIGIALRNLFTNYHPYQPIQCDCILDSDVVSAKGGVEITVNGGIYFTCLLNDVTIKSESNIKEFNVNSIPPNVSMRLYNFDDNIIREEILKKGNNLELNFPRCKVFTDFTMTMNSYCKCEVIPLVSIDNDKIFDMIIV